MFLLTNINLILLILSGCCEINQPSFLEFKTKISGKFNLNLNGQMKIYIGRQLELIMVHDLF